MVDLGAVQKNDPERRLSTLRVELENVTAAESQLADSDMAMEFVNFMKYSMSVKTSLAMLAHHAISAETTLKLITGKN